MNQKQLLEVTAAMKDEILNLLINNNLANDRTAKRTIANINNMFDRLDIEIEDVVPEEVFNHYFMGVDEATSKLTKAGLVIKGGSVAKGTSTLMSQVHLNAISEVTDNLMLDLKAAIRTSKRHTNISIIETLESVKGDLKNGIIKGSPRKEITKRVAESFNQNGMTSFITVDGKKLPLDFYSQVTTRTNLKKANTDGAVNRYIENGEDLVKVSGNTPTCGHCYSFRGKVFSLSGKDKRFPSAEGMLPPYHPQCQCSVSVWVIDYKTDAEIAKEVKRAKLFNPENDTRSKSQKKAYTKDQDRKRKLNDDKKQYASYKSVLGNDAPKTLGGYRRSKTSNSERFVEMKQDYRDAMKEIRSKSP